MQTNETNKIKVMAKIRPIIYWMPESPPCRTVYVVTKMIDFKDFDWKLIDLTKLEQTSEDYLKVFVNCNYFDFS